LKARKEEKLDNTYRGEKRFHGNNSRGRLLGKTKGESKKEQGGEVRPGNFSSIPGGPYVQKQRGGRGKSLLTQIAKGRGRKGEVRLQKGKSRVSYCHLGKNKKEGA